MSNDHCYKKNILLLAPSDNFGTLSEEEICCFMPSIVLCLLTTHCRRERVGNSTFLKNLPYYFFVYNFLK